MSRKGDCWDNAVAESFFATLRAAPDHELHVDTVQAGPPSATTSRTSTTSSGATHLGYLNPIEFELRSRTVKAAA